MRTRKRGALRRSPHERSGYDLVGLHVGHRDSWGTARASPRSPMWIGMWALGTPWARVASQSSKRASRLRSTLPTEFSGRASTNRYSAGR